MPPPSRNHRDPTAGDTPASAAASSLGSPAAIAAQNRCRCSRLATGGRPGDRIAGRPARAPTTDLRSSHPTPPHRRCCDDQLNPPWLPASEWWISSPATTGCPSRSRCHSAIRSGIITRSVRLDIEACQATIRREYTSRMNATYTNPAQVRT